MTRAHIDYTQRRSVQAEGFDPDTPTPGFYRIWGAGSLAVGVRIWNGPPHDPVTGEELDRSWRMQAHENGRLVDMARIWPRCARDPITEAEYDYLTGRAEWGRKHAPDSAQANPRRKVDLLTAPLPW